jgi:fucose 4-O-acetylase-like acetyltransferase
MINTTASRIEWIDLLKGYLLICICFSHFGYLPFIFKYLIYPTGSIYVPSFFILSGILYNDVKYASFKHFFISKAKTLFVPYIFLFFLFILLDWNIYINTSKTIIQIIKAITFAEGPPKAAPLWFVMKLFIINLFYYQIVA